jgi:hypothetical protein
MNVCSILVGEAKRKRMFGKHRYEFEDNTEKVLKNYDQGRVMFIRAEQEQQYSVVESFLNF